MSPRNLTRSFRASTGVSISDFRTKVRLELVRTLMNDPDLTLESVAERCGFRDARHLRRLWNQAFGEPPSQLRKTK
jgi:transcriptional regulator GlxA family with amidase domain